MDNRNNSVSKPIRMSKVKKPVPVYTDNQEIKIDEQGHPYFGKSLSEVFLKKTITKCDRSCI